jgi:hypothetical protein
VGYQSSERDTLKPDTGWILKQFGSTILDFRFNPYAINRYPYTLSDGFTFIFNKSDSLILYSNGSKIFNGKHRLIEGGDSLSYGSDWKTSPFAGNYFAEYNISLNPMAMVGLPSIKNTNQYYLISVFAPSDTINYKLVYSIVDMSLNGGRGKVIEKERILKYGDFTEGLTACKHGNGRDWWIIAREYGNKVYTIILLDSNGLKIKSEQPISNWDLSERNAGKFNFVNKFSWDGKYYASINFKGVEIFDFDRCTGLISNRRIINIPQNDTTANYSICFSKNNKYLYANSLHTIYQIEVSNMNIEQVASLMPYFDSTDDGKILPVPTVFGFTQLATDGRIFISSTSSSRHLSVIENPENKGLACNVIQQHIKLLTWTTGLPNYPNYELGAVADKCGESRIADNEIEKIEVYPNPVSEFLVVSGQKLAGISIEMYNLLGQKMSPSIEAKNQGYRLGVQTLPEGIYLLQVSDKNHNLIKTERLVISR